MTETYQALLQSFAQHVGLDGPTLAKTQEITIEGLRVGLMYEGDEQIGDIVYFTVLGTPAPQRLADVYKTLLEANNLWVGTGGSTLGIQPDSGQVVLCGRIDVVGVTAESLALLIDAFMDTALYWHSYVNDTLPPDAAAASHAFVRA